MKKTLALLGLTVFIIIAAVYLNWDWVDEHEDLMAGFMATAILVFALIVAIFTLRNMRHDRAASIAMELRQAYESGLVLEGRELIGKINCWQESHGIQDRQKSFLNTLEHCKRNYVSEFMKLISIPSLFDLIGWLVREKCCEAKAIDEQVDWEGHYNQWEPYIRQKQNKKEGEKLDDNPTALYGNFVWLAKEIKKD